MICGGHMNFPFIVRGNIINCHEIVYEDISVMLIIQPIQVCSPISFKYMSFWCLFSTPPHHILNTQYTPLKRKCSIERSNQISHVYSSGIHKNGCVQGVCKNHPMCEGGKIM